MLTKVQVGYKRLCDKLLAAVRPLGQQLRGKHPQVDFAEAEVAMLRNPNPNPIPNPNPNHKP